MKNASQQFIPIVKKLIHLNIHTGRAEITPGNCRCHKTPKTKGKTLLGSKIFLIGIQATNKKTIKHLNGRVFVKVYLKSNFYQIISSHSI